MKDAWAKSEDDNDNSDDGSVNNATVLNDTKGGFLFVPIYGHLITTVNLKFQ